MPSSLALVLTGLRARRASRRRGLPGLEFDGYGRRLALRELVGSRGRSVGALRRLANPVSCVRYFEFAAVADALRRAAAGQNGMLRVLDVSSPRLLPFWAAERMGLTVTMINPDAGDLRGSRNIARHVRADGGIRIAGRADATRMPFPDAAFDAATSVSVIEHVNGDGDGAMLDELARVVRPGGQVVLTFPVKPAFEDEFRAERLYGTQAADPATGRYFFQRFYDRDAIARRLLARPGVREESRRYFVEDPPGWFGDYQREWIRVGVAHTVHDPRFMADHFKDAGGAHPEDRLGVCCLVLRVVPPEGAA